MIFFVVYGHAIAGEISANIDIFGVTHYLIYCIHMPMFMFISGYLSKSKVGWKKVIKNYIIPYIAFDFLYVIFDFLKGGRDISGFNILIPTYVYWYILALGIMRLLVSSKVNKGIVLGGATLASSLISEEVWSFMALGRIALLWFIFWVGTKFTVEGMEFIRTHRVASIIILGVCILFELFFLGLHITSVTWATHDYPNNLIESVLKYPFMLFSIGCFAGFAAIVPENCRVLTRWRRNSILVYLLHPFVIDIVRFVMNRGNVTYNIMTYLLLMVVVAIITDFLARDIWRKAYDEIINKVGAILQL